jgi:16S rRNA (cytosine1402-N4)-methyltransferase
MYHKPVLLHDCIEGLNINPSGIYVDVTFGGGGHSKAILEKLNENGKLYAFDQDEDALQNKPNDPRLILINQNFRYLKNFLKFYQVAKIDGLLADLGVSSHQFDTDFRGFSIRFDTALDMRMSRKTTKTAFDVIQNYSEAQLSDLFWQLGELNNAKAIAAEIAAQRNIEPIKTVNDLKKRLQKFTNPRFEAKFFAQLFQALRIEVNDEMNALKEMLIQATELLGTGGRLVVLSYHSLEDRPVKNLIKTGNFEGKEMKDFFGHIHHIYKAINKKVITASEDEIKINNRARSAKLRIAEKL